MNSSMYCDGRSTFGRTGLCLRALCVLLGLGAAESIAQQPGFFVDAPAVLPGNVGFDRQFPAVPHPEASPRVAGGPALIRPLPECHDTTSVQKGGEPALPHPKVHHVCPEEPALPEAPAHLRPAVPAGAFVAPPQYGAVIRERSSWGLRGLRIRLPAISFETPSIEFPSLSRRDQSAHMELGAGVAPYVVGAGVPPSLPAYAGAAQRPSTAPARQQPAQTSQEKAAALEGDLAALQQKCERLEQLLEQLIRAQQCAPPQGELVPPPAPGPMSRLIR